MIIRDNMEINELHNYTQAQCEDLKQLMSELSDRVIFSQGELDNVLKDYNSHLYVMLDNDHIIGCATLCVFHSPMGTKASIEDVVVSTAYRGQHLGKQLVEYVLEQARQFAPIEIHLTSNPKRVAANLLYQSLGFQKKDTNCYQMFIEGATANRHEDNLKQSITYIIGKEHSEGNMDAISPDYVSRMLNVQVEEVEKCMRGMGV